MHLLVSFLLKRVLPATFGGYLALVLAMSRTTYAQPDASDATTPAARIFRAGAATSNITPKIGTSINGSMQDIVIQGIHDETHARSIVLDDGQTRLAIVVADLCMVSREVLDEAKRRAHAHTNIPVENMLMSATHTHSAGTACSVFQSDPDEDYLPFLSGRIADAVIRANNQLAPARIGWAVGEERSQVFNRRWKMKPGADMPNPFGGQDQVKMNPGVGNPDLLKPAGPIDPDVSVVSIQSPEGRPIALLANYSLHYVGGTRRGEVSADYFGMFADRMQQLLGTSQTGVPFVTMMSNGTSGDINNIHWAAESPPKLPPYAKMQQVANTVAAEAYKTIQTIEYHEWISLDARQEEITLGVRRPNAEEVERAQAIVDRVDGATMTSREEIYARETLLLQDYPNQVPILLQAFRLGDLAITAIPCEVFVEIGLELKQQSPFDPTFTISLANGYNGYLPTPEQHRLGGYETWRARSSYLETGASPKITQTLFELLDKLEASRTEPFELSAAEKKAGFEVLFDGTDMHHWMGNTKDYVVEDGVLVIYPERGGEGNLFTKDEYGDFIFRFEFQPTPGANNGLGIRAPLEGDAAYKGMELQILDNEADRYKELEQYQYHGSVYGVIAAKRGYLKPVGEWNYQEVIVKGSQIKVILNGNVILEGDIDKATKTGTLDGKNHPGLKRDRGHIGFLGHGSIVRFRNIRIKDLSAEIDVVQRPQRTSGVHRKSGESLSLFNGENLDGWYTFLKGRGRDNDPNQVFTVADGLIHISGEEWGCITTEKEYENYKLAVEYQWGGKTVGKRAEKARDNGVLIHSIGQDGGYDSTWMHSIECQIIEGGTGDFLVVGDGSDKLALTAPVAAEKQGSSYVFQPGGQLVTIHGGRINWYGRDPNWKDVKGFRGENDIEKPVGEWNRMECIAQDDEVTIYLNGTLVNHATRVKPTKGRIQIQSEGAEMLVRKVEWTPLPSSK